MKKRLTAMALALCCGFARPAAAQFATILFQENFDSIVLGPSVNERRGPLTFPTSTGLLPGANRHVFQNAYTNAGPAGWEIDNNFDNFGYTDLNNDFGTPYYDATVPLGEPRKLLYKVGIPGLIVGNIGTPNIGSTTAGPDEWAGWSFANKDFWVKAAGDQDRSKFTFGSGTIAVVDPDEYDDGGDGLAPGLAGKYLNSGLTTAAIPVSGLSSVTLKFDSSWRSEAFDDAHVDLKYTPNPQTNPPTAPVSYAANNQTAIIWATFKDALGNITRNDVRLWDSDGGHTSEGPLDPEPTRPASLTFKGDVPNETVTEVVSVPAGATSVRFTFGMINAANDWWWALDNLSLSDGANAPFWSENFDSLSLGPSTNEFEANDPVFSRITARNDDTATSPIENAFSHAAPTGWAIDNSGIKEAARGDNNIGVYEWEGWSFSTRNFWAGAQDGGAAGFLKASGVFAIADSDEFDDFGRNPNNETPNPNYTRPMDTILESPAIDLAGVAANSVFLKFDSSWRWEGNQKAIVTVDFGGGQTEVLRWESVESSAFFHDDNLNETVMIPLNNPAGASSAVVRFKYLDAGNNWWWAIDNVQIGTVPEPGSAALLGVAVVAACGIVRRRKPAVG